jgi:hypothetical protein
VRADVPHSLGKIHENEKDRAEEQRICDRIIEVRKRPIEIVRNGPTVEEIDRRVRDVKTGKVLAFAEVKRRYIRFGQYDTIFLDLSKWRGGIELGKRRGIPTYFFVGCDDFICSVEMRDHKDLMVEPNGGRTRQTREGLDYDVTVHIPLHMFTILCRWKDSGDMAGRGLIPYSEYCKEDE